jgi:prophage regulatory protein
MSLEHDPSRQRVGGRLLRLPAVEEFCGLRRTQIHELIARKEFPAPIKLSDSGRAKAWLEEELMTWRDQRRANRDRGGQ